ncbi:type II toxin-antitoxin system RelB/DinJ family antitoxin [Candidatus Roizmanbacteria bacterium]|nr:type II toxin-antitoxin system RelB/DinJ family antitoxin [Candidatus Roizmanbacteria bacterium]
MNTAVINVKVNPRVKTQAQQVVEELGLSLSGVINAFLKQLVRTKSVSFTTSEEPTAYLLQALKESHADIKDGRVSPSFTSAKDATQWLNKHKKTKRVRHPRVGGDPV